MDRPLQKKEAIDRPLQKKEAMDRQLQKKEAMDRKAWFRKLSMRKPSYVQEPVPLKIFDMDLHFYTLAEILIATDKFNENGVIGRDRFGEVYKGILPSNNKVVAVKRWNHHYPTLLLPLSRHRNLAHLHGTCEEGPERLLVYEFLPMGSLDKILHGDTKDTILDWDTRLRIAVGVTEGLQYLHERGVLHHNLNSENVLLRNGFEPKLANFWTKMLNPIGKTTHLLIDPRGTCGYMDPDYVVTGERTVKTDIYSLGVILLELITGRKALDNTRDYRECSMVLWAQPKFKDHSLYQTMVDPKLKGRFEEKQLVRIMMIAARCVNAEPRLRPSAAEALKTLSCIISCPTDECDAAE